MTDLKSDRRQLTDQNKKLNGVCNQSDSDRQSDGRSPPKSASNGCNSKSEQTRPDKSTEIPELRMDSVAYKSMLLTIGSHRPETGGILLGPIGSNDITTWYFDRGGNCTGASYSPDHVNLNQRMKDIWLPLGIDMKGFVHSHPGRHDWLTTGDLAYINRLLDKNDDMTMFAAPIVIPVEFRMRAIVVLREKPRQPQEARLVLF